MNAAPRPWYRRNRTAVTGGLVVGGLLSAAAWLTSPWPAALLIRALFDKGARDTVAEMTPYVPDGVDAVLNVAYAPGGPTETLDVFWPAGTDKPLPTVVWIHGGAWISGAKEDVNPYARMIASRGYTTVSLNYAVSPGVAYPTALRQLNAALAFLVEHAAEFNIDPGRLVLAGDSAGAQLTSQLANVITNPAYAASVQLSPALTPEQLAAVILNCGIYDVSEIPNAPGLGGWGFRVALWGYLGRKDWAHTRGGTEMSSHEFVTAAFPSTWISGGNGDPLTDTQSRPFAARLAALGVPVTAVFYDADHKPELPHEYQFHLDFADARAALDSTLAFLATVRDRPETEPEPEPQLQPDTTTLLEPRPQS